MQHDRVMPKLSEQLSCQTFSRRLSKKLRLEWFGCQTHPFSWSVTESSVPGRVHRYSSWLFPLHCKPSVSVLSLALSNPISCLGAPAGPTTTKACWSTTAQSLNMTGLKGFSWGEKAHIPLSVKQPSIVSAGPPSKQTWNYSISVCHMSSGAVQKRGGLCGGACNCRVTSYGEM